MPKKILLADDSITIQKVIGLTFANEDVQLTVVDNGDEAMIKAKEIIPDLIIADVVMPGKDGYEVCYSTKADAQLQHIPVLLLTGTFETFDEAMATKVGADGFITKPFESQALIDKVNELIGRAARPKTPSINDLGSGASQVQSHDLDDPMNNIDSMDTMDAFEPVDSLEPMDSLEPVEALEPMELEEIAPVEENPMEEFASMEPDSSESSFADVSLDEPAPAKSAFEEPETSFADFDLASSAAEPEPMAAAAPAPAPSAPIAPIAAIAEDKPFVSSHVPVLSPDADWNMNGLTDYMAESAGAAPQSAAPDTVPDFDTAEAIDMEPQPVALEAEPPAAFTDAPEIQEMDNDPVPANVPISAESDVWNTPQNSIQSALAAEPASFDDAPVAFDDAPAAFDDAPVAVEEAPAYGENALSMQETEEYSDDPVAEEAPFVPPAPVEISEVDGHMELTPIAANLTPPSLEQVADMYPLDDAPEAAPAPVEVRPLPASVFDTPAPAEIQRAAAPAQSNENFEIQSQRLSEMIESRVRATLADDQVLSAFSNQASRLIEAKIEEAINKVAPQVIEQLVRKALTDATEKILNETIGRLRKD